VQALGGVRLWRSATKHLLGNAAKGKGPVKPFGVMRQPTGRGGWGRQPWALEDHSSTIPLTQACWAES